MTHRGSVHLVVTHMRTRGAILFTACRRRSMIRRTLCAGPKGPNPNRIDRGPYAYVARIHQSRTAQHSRPKRSSGDIEPVSAPVECFSIFVFTKPSDRLARSSMLRYFSPFPDRVSFFQMKCTESHRNSSTNTTISRVAVTDEVPKRQPPRKEERVSEVEQINRIATRIAQLPNFMRRISNASKRTRTETASRCRDYSGHEFLRHGGEAEPAPTEDERGRP